MNDFSQLAKLCEGKHVYIQTHNFPDPDAIASAFGLQRLLELHDISSALCYDGRLDKLSASKMLEAFQIQMYAYEQLRPTLSEEDYIICVDAQKHAGNITDFVGDEVACIDHHPLSFPQSTAIKTYARQVPALPSSPNIFNSWATSLTRPLLPPCSTA